MPFWIVGFGILGSLALAASGILVKPLGDTILGRGYMRVTTSLPADNARFVEALRALLA